MSPIDDLPVGFPIRKNKSRRISSSTDNTDGHYWDMDGIQEIKQDSCETSSFSSNRTSDIFQK